MSVLDFLAQTNDFIRIESKLGSGGSGAVYKAWHKRLQKHVIIKEIMHSKEDDAPTRRNEIEALKNIRSPYVPQAYDYFSCVECSYSVLEYFEGESFDKLLARGCRFADHQVIRWYTQLAVVLAVIHEQNVCHRDIKPANIVLTSKGEACLIDFNAALVKGNDIRVLSRSLVYASPEQHELFARYEGNSAQQKHHIATADSEEVSDFIETQITSHRSQFTTSTQSSIDWKRSDIYSLGATMYHLLTGVRPPAQAEKIIPISKVLKGRYNKDLVYIIERSMQKDPSKRFKTASHLAEAVKRINKSDSRQKLLPSKKVVAITALAVVATVILSQVVLSRK